MMRKIQYYDDVERCKIGMRESYSNIEDLLRKGNKLTDEQYHRLCMNIWNLWSDTCDARELYEMELEMRGAKTPWFCNSWPPKVTVGSGRIDHYDGAKVPSKYHTLCEDIVSVETSKGCVEQKIR